MKPAFLNGRADSSDARRTTGYTLLELLLVIGLIAIVAALLYPALQKARVESQGAQSMATLRRFQIANEAYAAEHNGWYVPYGIYSVDDNVYTEVWYKNMPFRNYLGFTEIYFWGREYYPRKLTSPGAGAASRLSDGYMPIGRSYGYNSGPFDVISRGPQPIYQIRTSAIHHPSRLMAFADSLDWWVDFTTADNYSEGREDFTRGAVAYRYNGKAAVVYFDGHGALLRRDQAVNNRPLFLNDP